MRNAVMKCLLLVLALSLSCGADASITRVGTATASATTVTCPTHAIGDDLVIAAIRGGSTTAPTLPSGWVSVLTKSNATATTVSMRIGYRIATSTTDASGTWTNASELICAVYRPSSGNFIRIGQNASSSSTTATVTFPALSMADSASGNSWVVGFVGAGNKTQSITVAPSGMTNETSVVGSTYEAALHDTNAGVSSWSSNTANVTGTGSTVSATVEMVLAPTTAFSGHVYQHIGGGGNPFPQGQTGTVFKLPLDKLSGAGNALVLAFTNDGAATITSVTDNINGTWPAATVTALQGSGNEDSRIYVEPNIAAGKTTVTVTFSAAVTEFSYDLSELYGVAISSPGAGSSSNGATQSTSTAVPSFTPTNNNSTGGNLIWAYFVKADPAPTTNTTALFATSPFTLLSANSSWIGTGGYQTPNLVEAEVQATSAAIVPGMTSAAETGGHWNSLAVALKVSSGSGTAPPTGIQINAVHHFSTVDFPATGTFVIQAPSVGNLRLIGSDDPNLNSETVTDSEGNTWSSGAAGTGLFYLPNASANPNLVIYITGGGGDPTLSWRYVDISGAATSPYDTSVAAGQMVAAMTTSFTSSPAPSAGASGELGIAQLGLGEGPGLAVTAPATAIWDLATYTGETDTDLMENADIMAHFITTGSSAQTWTWTITSVGAANNISGGFIYFKPAPPPSGPPASQFFLGDLTPANADHFLLRAGAAR